MRSLGILKVVPIIFILLFIIFILFFNFQFLVPSKSKSDPQHIFSFKPNTWNNLSCDVRSISLIDDSLLMTCADSVFVRQNSTFVGVLTEGKILYTDLKGKTKWKYIPEVEDYIFSSPTIADFNNDGKSDFIIGGESLINRDKTSEKIYLFSKKDINFKSSLLFEYNTFFIYSISSADLDNDGYTDIGVSGFDIERKEGKIIIYRNNQTLFSEVWNYSLGREITDIKFADFNGDGNIDVLISGFKENSKGVIQIFLNDGNFKFLLAKEWYFDKNPIFRIDIVDLDNDGYPDFFASGLINTMYIFFNLDFQFNKVEVNSGFKVWSMNTADFNNDGLTDVVLGGINEIIVFLNERDNFKEGEIYKYPKNQIVAIHAIFPIDIDEDGDIDLLLSENEGLRFLLNEII